MVSRRARVYILLASLSAAACSTQPNGAKPLDASDALHAIPPADPARYERVHDMRDWRNPYLLVRTDGVDLLDAADNAEIHLKPEELVPALGRLPVSAWPYGRVVAVAETPRASEQDGTAIRRMKGIVGGVLEGSKVNVKWVPAG